MDPDDFGQQRGSGWTHPGEHSHGYEYDDDGRRLARHASHQRSEEWQPPGGWNLGRGCCSIHLLKNYLSSFHF